MTGLSKVFNCVSHDMLNSKLKEYGFTIDALALVFLYLSNRKLSVPVKSSNFDFKNIILGASRGSKNKSYIFQFIHNRPVFFITISPVYNFAENNNLSA